jgi:cell wall-associated NlpC family hydrolase
MALAFCVGILLAAGIGKERLLAAEYDSSLITDISLDVTNTDTTYPDDTYIDYTYPDTVIETPEKTVEWEYEDFLTDQALAKGKTRTFSIEDRTETDEYGNIIKPTNITWEFSSSTNAAEVTSNSMNQSKLKVKALSKGYAWISVTYDLEFDTYIKRCNAECGLYVSEPALETKTLNISKYDSWTGSVLDSATGTVQISGLQSDSTVTCTSKSKYLTVTAEQAWWGSYWDIDVTATKKGTYKVKLDVDGKKMTLKVVVTAAYFKLKTAHSVDVYMDKNWHEGSSMLALYKGATEQLKIKGLKSGTKVKWKSSNKKVATVNQSGVVRAKKNGYCTITAKFEGGSITYEVGVASKAATKAVYYAIKHFGSEYSQENRMAEGKYDCSSYIYRAYKDAGVTLGDSKNWAPTAAELGKWCSDKGYVLYYEDEEVDVSKLRPGDLIFETGENNGRYKGIYHVDLYTGNYSSLTVERTKWYGDTMTGVIIARPCP